jgi:ring-1,2-phenylacetyl-CoA epoxidase subunit PaaA
MRRLVNKSDKTKGKVQDAVDWMFPMGIEWFGMPDDKKHNTAQLDYRIKGKTNDELRQEWMSHVVPLAQELNLDVPAHYDEESDEYVLEYDMPVAFDADTKEWRFDEPIGWDDVLDRWRARGPANERHVEMIQSGKLEVAV